MEAAGHDVQQEPHAAPEPAVVGGAPAGPVTAPAGPAAGPDAVRGWALARRAEAVAGMQRGAGNVAVNRWIAGAQLQRQPHADSPEDPPGKVARLLHAHDGSNASRDGILRACMEAATRYDDVVKAWKLVDQRNLLDAAKALGQGTADAARVYAYLRFGKLRLADKLFFAGIGAGTDKETVWRLLPQIRAQFTEVEGEFKSSYGSEEATAFGNEYKKDGTLIDGSPSRIAGFLDEEADDEVEETKFRVLLTYGEVRPVDEIYMAVRSVHAFAGGIMGALDKVAKATPPGTKPNVEATYLSTYKINLTDQLKAELGEKSENYARARLILDGDYTTKNRIKLACEGVGTGMKEIWAALDDARASNQLAPLKAEWEAGGEIKQWLDGELLVTKADKDRIAAILKNESTMDARLAQLGLEIDDTKAILKAALERDDVRASFATEWANTNGDFYKRFTNDGKRGTVWGDDLIRGDWMKRLTLAAIPIESEDGVLKLLASPEATDERRKTVRSDPELLGALQKMDAWPRIDPLLQPRQDLRQRADWLKDRFEKEAMSGLQLGSVSAAAYAFDDEQRELDVALGKAKDPHNLTDEERKKIGPLAQGAEDALASFIRVRDELDAVAIQVVGAVAGLLATALTGGAAGPVAASMLARAALAQGCASVAAVWVVKGERTTGGEAARAFAVGSASGATGALVASPIMAALSPEYSAALKSAGAKVAEDIAAREFSTVGLGTMKAVTEGLATGVTGSAVESASKIETWRSGFVEGLKTVFEDAAKGGLTGAAMGGVVEFLRLSLFGKKPGAAGQGGAGGGDVAETPTKLEPAHVERARVILESGEAITFERWQKEILPQIGGGEAVAREALGRARQQILQELAAKVRVELAAQGVDLAVPPRLGFDGELELLLLPQQNGAAVTPEAQAGALKAAAAIVGKELDEAAQKRLGVKVSADAAGGVMGPDVYPTSNRTLKPDKLKELMKNEVVGATGPWAVEGTTLRAAAADLVYELSVPGAAAGAPASMIDVKVSIVAGTDLAGGAHPTAAGGSVAGRGRVTLKPPDATGRWTAEVQIDANLAPESVKFVAGHEIDEIARIVRTLPAGADQAAINAQMKAGVFTHEPLAPAKPGEPPAATAHDHAAAVELYELMTRQGRAAKPEEKRALGESMTKLVHYMALDDPTNLGAKLALLAEHGAGDEWKQFIDSIRDVGATAATVRATALSGGALPAGSLLGQGLIDTAHIVLPEPHTPNPAGNQALASWDASGISGGHDNAALLAWVRNTEHGYALGPPKTKSAGGVDGFCYDQYFWEGAGPPVAFKPGDPVPAGWRISNVPKTTVGDIGAFLQKVDAALVDYIKANHGGAMPVQARPALTLDGGMRVDVWIQNGRVTSAYPVGAWF